MILSRPALRGDQLVFVCEDDLWTVAAQGGQARRLTRGVSRIDSVQISQDGTQVALVASEEGAQDIFSMPSDGGDLERRTWLGTSVRVLGFSPDDQHIRFAARRGGPLDKQWQLWEVPTQAGVHRPLKLGPVIGFAESAAGRVICRFVDDLSRWRRYRGGRVGRLWVDTGEGWTELPDLGGNLASPFWMGERLGFVSDHEGHANLYSSAPDGSDVQALTHHDDHAVLHPTCDGETVVYAHGGDLRRLGDSDPLDIRTQTQRPRLQRRFPVAARFLQGASVHPDGHSLALTIRGKPFVGGHWEGPMVQLGQHQGARYGCISWLDSTHLMWSNDASGEEHLEIFDVTSGDSEDLGAFGHVVSLCPGKRTAFVTSDGVLRTVEDGDVQEVGRCTHGTPRNLTWSHDGAWLAWSEPIEGNCSVIRLLGTDGVITDLTEGRSRDVAPSFDPLGRHLYFISYREFSPVRDSTYFGYGFPKGARPYLITLQDTLPSPFEPAPRDFAKAKPPKAPEKVEIDLDGIRDRIVRFPVPEATYSRVVGLPSGKVLLQRSGVNAAQVGWKSGVQPGRDTLVVYDLPTNTTEVVHNKINHFTLDAARKTVCIRSGNRLRVFPADPDKGVRTELKKVAPFKANRKSYWIDLNRIRLEIEPRAEWGQMAQESWRLLRDHFWERDLAGVDWDVVHDRYMPLVERAATRSELSAVLWAMGAELATSHAYEMGGAYPSRTVRTVGRLCADFSWEDGWKVERVHRGDAGDPTRSSPLLGPGRGIVEGSVVHAVNGVPVREDRPLEASLVGHAGRPVQVEVTVKGERRAVIVTPRASDQGARYRTWVNDNRARVHAETDSQVGYVHIPDMGPAGFADFHRDYLRECDRTGLIVDVRFNGGGHVSQLLLSRLMKRRLAWVRPRHGSLEPYPAHSVLGPMVALTNEGAGSDGDIFSYNWKSLKLGPLIGTRTWGGVVGISPRVRLVDNTIVTQPEYAFWFEGGAGFGVEGHGVDPDIEVRHSPEDHAAQTDPQLTRALAEILPKLKGVGPPDLGPIPKR